MQTSNNIIITPNAHNHSYPPFARRSKMSMGSILVVVWLSMIGKPRTRKHRLKMKRNPTSSPGTSRGRVTRLNVCSHEAPATWDASSNSGEIWEREACVDRTANVIYLLINATIKIQRVP